jgi:DNA-binding IclR family transcriptional regulator
MVTASVVEEKLDQGAEDGHSVLGRAAKILDAFTGDVLDLSLTQLAERASLPKSTCYRFAERLCSLGWLEHASSGYRIGIRLFEIGELATSRSRLCGAALPELQQVAIGLGCVAHLAVLDGPEIVYLLKVPARGLSVPTREGGRMPTYCTALGKALVAFSNDDELERVIESGLEARTCNTIVNPAALRQEISEIQRAGYATDRGEFTSGLACVAVPVRGSGRAVGAISLTGHSETLDLNKATRVLLRSAPTIWQDMFHSSAA